MTEKVGLEGVFETTDFETGVDTYLDGLARIDGETGKFVVNADAAFRAVGSGFLNAGATITKGVGALVAGGTAAVVGAIASSSNLAMGLEQQMANVSSVMSGSVEDLEQVGDLAQELGVNPELKVEAVQAAQAIEMLAKNGLTAREVLEGAAEATVLLSNSTGAEFSTAADVATDTMELFNIEAKNMRVAVDGITAVTTSSKFDINDYSLALANGGSAAKQMGVSLEDFNAVIAATSSFFASGQTAGTSFRNFIKRLVPNTEVAADAMRDLNLITEDGTNAFFTASGELKNMAEVADLLKGSLGQLGVQEQVDVLRSIFGEDGAAAAIALIEGGGDAIREMSNQLSGVSAADVAATRVDTLAGSLEILRSVFDGVRIQIGDLFLPVIRRVTVAITGFISENQQVIVAFFQKVSEGVSTAVGAIGRFLTPLVSNFSALAPVIAVVTGAIVAFLAVLGPMLMLVGGALTAIGFLIPAFTTLAGIISTVGLPVILLIGGAIVSLITIVTGLAVAVGAAITAVATNFGGLRDAIQGVFTTIAPVVDQISGRVKEGFGGIGRFISGTLMPALRFVASFVAQNVIPIFGTALKAALEVALAIFNRVSEVLRSTVAPGFARIGEAARTLAPVFMRLGGVVRDFAQIAIQVAGTVLQIMANRMGETGKAGITLEAVLGFIATSVENFALALNYALDAVEWFVDKLRLAKDVLVAVAQAMNLVNDAGQQTETGFSGVGDSAASADGDLANYLDRLEEANGLSGEFADKSEEGDNALQDLIDSLLGGEDAMSDMADATLAGNDAFGDYFTNLMKAETGVRSLNSLLAEGVTELDSFDESMVGVIESSEDYSSVQVEQAALLAEIMVKRDELLATMDAEGRSIDDVRTELNMLYGDRLRDVNATILQIQENERLAEIMSGAMKNAYSSASSAIKDYADAYQGELQARLAGDAEAAEEMQERQQTAYEAVVQSYRQMIFDMTAASDGVFDELDKQLGVQLGIYTETEADMRLSEQNIQNTIELILGTAEMPDAEMAAALRLSLESGDVSGTDVDRLLTNIRQSVESGLDKEVEAVVATAVRLAESDGTVDTTDIQNIIESTDITQSVGDRLDADVIVDLAATLDSSGVASFNQSVNSILEATELETQRQKAIDLLVKMNVQGETDPAQIDTALAQVFAVMESRQITFDEALTILVEAETAQAQADLQATQTEAQRLQNLGEIGVNASADVSAAVGPFQQMQTAMDGLDGRNVLASASASADVSQLQEAQTKLGDLSGASATPQVSVQDNATSALSSINTELKGIDGSLIQANFSMDVSEGEAQLATLGQSASKLAPAVEAAVAPIPVAVGGAYTQANTSATESLTTLQTNNTTSLSAVTLEWTNFGVNLTNTNAVMWSGLNNSTVAFGQMYLTSWSNIMTNLNVNTQADFVVLNTTFSENTDQIAATLQTKVPVFQDVGRAIMNGLTAGANSVAGQLATALVNEVNSAISAARTAAAVASPSKKTTAIGVGMGQGLSVGAESQKKNFVQTMRSVVNGALQAAEGVASSGVSFGRASADSQGYTSQIGRRLGGDLGIDGVSGTNGSFGGLTPPPVPGTVATPSNTATTIINNYYNIDESTSVHVDAHYSEVDSPARISDTVNMVLSRRTR